MNHNLFSFISFSEQYRSKQISIQSFTNSSLLDVLFSAHAITVDLKEIFPSIEAKKLVRNSSAVWNTPPRYSQMAKY
jgi:inner centromere protein